MQIHAHLRILGKEIELLLHMNYLETLVTQQGDGQIEIRAKVEQVRKTRKPFCEIKTWTGFTGFLDSGFGCCIVTSFYINVTIEKRIDGFEMYGYRSILCLLDRSRDKGEDS